jgi:hypothetical protein
LNYRPRHQRFIRRLETEFVANGKHYRAISSDFSRSGLFVRTNRALVPGTELDIVIHLPNGFNAQLKGLVRRAIKTPVVSLKNGMGIELISRDSNYISFLKELDPSETGDTSPAPTPDSSQAGHPSEPDHPATPEFVIVACKKCGAKNKVRRERLSHDHKCGKCGSLISPPL